MPRTRRSSGSGTCGCPARGGRRRPVPAGRPSSPSRRRRASLLSPPAQSARPPWPCAEGSGRSHTARGGAAWLSSRRTHPKGRGQGMVEGGRRKWYALALLCTVQFMVVLDIAIVNVALPSIQKDLHFTQESLQWVITAYALVFGGFLLLGGRSADLLGR